ncbi:MAG: TonB-dependent receptor, partial [Thermoanaerobaculia bacterium]|nr:TonB-dependent receptor [Thermoanaerobaculia bacterium]
TWRLTSAQNLALSVIGDPRTTDGVVFPVSGPESTFEGEFETGSDDLLARYDGVFGGSWVIEGLAGLHKEETRTNGPGKDIPLYIDRRGARPFPNAGGFGFHQDDDVERQVLKVDVSKFLGSSLELKLGVDQEDLSITSRLYNGGAGQRIYIFNNADDPNGPPVYRHRFYVDDRAPGFDRDDPSTWQLLFPLVSEPETVNNSAYAQASWKVLPNLTINAGARWEGQEVKDRDGNTSIEIDDNLAPRLQMVWDPRADGRSKVFGSFGRYYESVPLDINVRAFGGENQCFCYNFSPDPDDFRPISDDESGFGTTLLGGATPVDPDLKGQFVDEFMLGYEYEVLPNFAVGIQGTYRELGRVIEDFLIISEGNYFIANPGEGIGSVATFYDYVEVPADKPKREYTGVELTARKRYSDGWQLYASYLWSKLEGNYDGVFQASAGQLDPNINSAFDYADFLINADGKLTNDREHSFKVNGSYTFQEGPLADFNIGLSAYWRSGTPLSAYGYSFAYSNWEYYLTPRGALGRNPSEYEADLHLGYPLKLGTGELQFQLDVFNLLDRQAITSYDQRYNLETSRCAGIPDELCNGDGGLQHDGESLDPVGQLDDPRATATNPDFLKRGAAFSGQRSIRVGIRYRF